jgi:hypothetical protein
MTWFRGLSTFFRRLRNTRLYRRLAVKLPVRLLIPGTDRTIETRLHDWSPGGVFVEAADPLPLFSFVDLEFSLGESGGSRLRLRGQVVRHQAGETPGGVTGMGIMFTDFTESGLEVLREFLTKQSMPDAPSAGP